MIPQVGGFQGCYLDTHCNNWRCARAVRALCENAPIVIHKMPLSTHLLMQLMQLLVVLMQLLLMHSNLCNEKLGDVTGT